MVPVSIRLGSYTRDCLRREEFDTETDARESLEEMWQAVITERAPHPLALTTATWGSKSCSVSVCSSLLITPFMFEMKTSNRAKCESMYHMAVWHPRQ